MNKRTLDEIYREIGNSLASSADSPWKTLMLTATVTSDHVSAKYELQSDGPKAKSYWPPSRNSSSISLALIEMRQLMSSEGKAPWNKVRFTLVRSGRFHVDYSYGEPVEGS